MKASEVIDIIDRQPFIPFDVRTSDGRGYRIDHPEFVMRSRDGNTLYLQTDDDRNVRLDSHHIVAIEDANAPARA